LSFAFPPVKLKLRTNEDKVQVFDSIRAKWIRFTPEEAVRQNLIHYLIHEKNYPKGLIAVEKRFSIHQRTKAFDLLIYNLSGNPVMLVECKAADVILDENTVFQLAGYNAHFGVSNLMITNQLNVYWFKYDPAGGWQAQSMIPSYDLLL
jgi:hypothetical protein